MQTADFARLTTFVAVAERRSFVRAADMLHLSTSSVSHAVRSLEERLGVRLLNRTTRRVDLTEAGQRLLEQVRPALLELEGAIEGLNAFRDRPAGVVRLSVSSLALCMMIAPALPGFYAAYPDVILDIAVDNDSGDLLDGRVDAGVRGPERIPQDMIAVRIGPPSRVVAVASPGYLNRYGRPSTLADLRNHNCVLFRFPSGATHRWSFEDHGRRIDIAPSGSLVTDNVDLLLGAAVDGVGISYTVESHAGPYLRAGELEVVLEDYALPFAGWFIYHTSRRQIPTPLKVFVDHMYAAGTLRTQEILSYLAAD